MLVFLLFLSSSLVIGLLFRDRSVMFRGALILGMSVFLAMVYFTLQRFI